MHFVYERGVVIGNLSLGPWASTSEGIVFARQSSRILRCLSAVFVIGFSIAGFSPAKAEIGSHILIDAKTGKVLDERDSTRKWYPASLTKMMTAYVTFKAIRAGDISLTSPVVQSKNSISEPPSKMGFKVGTMLTIDAALKIILIKSANDVAVAIGEAVAGSEAAFIDRMNAEARRLNMLDSVFVNPHGLPDNRQVTTARDMAILAQALRRDFPEARKIYKHPGVKFGKKTLRSANREYLMRVPGADGMKTGFICNSGYNVAASATRNGRTLIAVVLGAASGLERIAFTRELMDDGFKKRSAKYTLATLPRRGGQPPADRYCKRNKKPGVDGIMARFDMQGKKKSPVMSFSANQKQGSILLPNFRAKKEEPVVDSGPVKLANGKVDWGKVMDRTIGPRRIAYAPITVRTGVPNGSKAPLVLAPTDDIPVPTAKPAVRVVTAPAVTAQSQAATAAPAGAVPQQDFVPSSDSEKTASPGSIFRKGFDFKIPVPVLSPRK